MNLDNYNGFMQAFDHLKEKIDILRETQIMLNKEIWKKKQLLKIMLTNKSFAKGRVSFNFYINTYISL